MTADLTDRFDAVELVRVGAEVLGGKGGGGRPDMAQAGGPDGGHAEAALARDRTGATRLRPGDAAAARCTEVPQAALIRRMVAQGLTRRANGARKSSGFAWINLIRLDATEPASHDKSAQRCGGSGGCGARGSCAQHETLRRGSVRSLRARACCLAGCEDMSVQSTAAAEPARHQRSRRRRQAARLPDVDADRRGRACRRRSRHRGRRLPPRRLDRSPAGRAVCRASATR